MLDHLTVLFLISLSTISLSALLKPLLVYFKDEKGLRKYPMQNWFSGIHNLAYGFEVGRDHELFHTRRLHERLVKDPIIRIGPNWLSFGRAQAAQDIYGYTSPCLKADVYDKLAEGGKHINVISNKAAHSTRRRMVASSYAPKNQETWEPGVADSMMDLRRAMDPMCTKPLKAGEIPEANEVTFDANKWLLLFGYETILKIGLSKDTHFIDSGNDLLDAKEDGSKKVTTIENLHSLSRATSPLIWDTNKFGRNVKLSKLLSNWFADNWARGEDYVNAVKLLVNDRIERFKAGEVLDDLFQPMMEDKYGANPDISQADILAEIATMINAGGDGPGLSIIYTLYYLVKNPQTFQKLREELDSVLSPSDTIAPWSKVKSLPYFRACIDESLRLSPPVATDLMRRTPPEGLKIDTDMIPGNTNVSISAYTTHRDPEVFEDPEAFIPERWQTKDEEKLKAMRAAHIPFSAGTRGCIGRNVTILQQAVSLGTLVYHYDFALPSPKWEMEWEDFFNIWPKELHMKVWQRAHREPASSA
ncbi:MAG: hypothetical protein Q9227_003253 [Pyrenula ochraceoflavens]